jgi:hypothetical protein
MNKLVISDLSQLHQRTGIQGKSPPKKNRDKEQLKKYIKKKKYSLPGRETFKKLTNH